MKGPDQPTSAEAAGAAFLTFPAVAIVLCYLMDWVGLTVAPWLVLGVSIATSGLVGLRLNRAAVSSRVELVALVGIVAALFVWLLRLARPYFLPLGWGPDLTHHLLLIEYIERHWHLVREANVEPFLGEMVHYTPGSHFLAALVGRWTGSDGLHSVHAVMALVVALKAGLVFLIAARVLAGSTSRIPFAIITVALLFLPRAYFLDSFVQSSFFAQVVSETFAVAMWWALVVWDDTGSLDFMALFALAGAALFLTWPVWIGVPLLTLGALVVFRRGIPIRQRAVAFAVSVIPITAIAALYMWHRLGWLGMARATGGVIRPTPEQYGWWFLALSLIGLAVAPFVRRGRITACFVAALALESLALRYNARATGDTPYLAFKMFYLGIYPQAVAAMLLPSLVWEQFERPARSLKYRRTLMGVLAGVAWIAAVDVSVRILRPAIKRIRPQPVISEQVYLAGQWARAHVKPSCVEYLVGNDSTAYWLHLSVLGNPRMLTRSGEGATYDPQLAIIRWLTPGGLPYAIADLPKLPRDVREDLDIVAQFGSAAVVRRRGPSNCPDFR